MATITHHDESLVESNEVFYPTTNMIDNEPYYNNFMTIQNVLKHYDKKKQTDIRTKESMNHTYRANRVQIQISSSSPYYSSEQVDSSYNDSSTIPNQSVSNSTKSDDDESIYSSQTLQIISSLDDNTNSIQSNTALQSDEVSQASVNTNDSYINKQYFSRWYHERYKCSTSMNQLNSIDDANEKSLQQTDNCKSHIIMHSPIQKKVLSKQINEDHIQTEIEKIYGIDDADTETAASSLHSSIEEINRSPQLNQPTKILRPIDNLNSKKCITIHEHYPRKEMPSLMGHRSVSSVSLHTIEDDECKSFFRNHPEFNNDPNPKIIPTPNSQEVTYKQNISIRYLVPPTPPPNGPLIIREIVPPPPPSPPPLIIEHNQSESLTPSPRIIREVPPTPPPYQEAQVITKIIPQEPPPSQSFIIEQSLPLPPKPQSIIIEKWLPYKPAPPREVIYERLIQTPMVSQFQPSHSNSNDRQTYFSTQSYSTPSSCTYFGEINKQQSSVLEQFAWLTQQQIEEIERQTFEQICAHQKWLANQQQQSVNFCMPPLTQLTTPALVVNHAPITRTIYPYSIRDYAPQQLIYEPIFMCSSYQ